VYAFPAVAWYWRCRTVCRRANRRRRNRHPLRAERARGVRLGLQRARSPRQTRPGRHAPDAILAGTLRPTRPHPVCPRSLGVRALSNSSQKEVSALFQPYQPWPLGRKGKIPCEENWLDALMSIFKG